MKNVKLEEILTTSNKIKVFDKYNVCFAYMLKNALNLPLRIVYVTNDQENNLHLIKDMDNEIVATINVDELNKVLLKHEEKIDKSMKISLSQEMILDGYINDVYFKVNNNWYNDSINNLFYYDKKNLDENKHLSEVVGLLNDVYETIYKQNNQVKEYFILCDNEKNTEF